MIRLERGLTDEAKKLNDIVSKNNPEILDMLTPRGLRAYFPNTGIVKQSLEAKKHGTNFNASIGVAVADDGKPMVFDEVTRLMASMEIPLASGINYGSSAGLPALRELLRGQVGIEGMGLPVITSGLTHALADIAALFCDEETMVILPSFFWENIQLLFQNIFGSRLLAFPFYNEPPTGFNVEGLAESISRAYRDGARKLVVYLNFPNNPTGYNITDKEGSALRAMFEEALEKMQDLKIIVVSDEAYYGLSYKNATKQPVMGFLLNLNPRLLVIGAKGPTKEVNVWGLRIGALWTMPYGMDTETIKAMNEKFAGTTRGLISMPSVVGQEMVMRIYQSINFLANSEAIKATMVERAGLVDEVLCSPKFQQKMPVFPFNAGYFCCCKVTGAEAIRQKLLVIGGGVIAGCEYNDISLGGSEFIRLAFSCMPAGRIPEIMETVIGAI